MKTMISEKTNSQERPLTAALTQTEELVSLHEETKDKLDPSDAGNIEEEINRRL
jgi:hypothetical protein